MEFRELARTGERISTIGMGTWRFGVFTNEEERSVEVHSLRRGLELGITLIDTAESYSGGKAEEVVGEAVQGAEARDSVFIASKVSPDNLRKADLLAACERSLKRLRTSYIDLYQVHWPNPRIPIKETMAAMEDLVSQGKVRYVGVSNFSVGETEAARQSMAKAEVVSNQVEYSLMNRSVEKDILPYCEREKLTLVAYSPLARGRLVDERRVEALQRKYGLTTAQVMLNWVTRSESVVAIPKASNVRHLEEDAQSVSTRFAGQEYDQVSRS